MGCWLCAALVVVTGAGCSFSAGGSSGDGDGDGDIDASIADGIPRDITCPNAGDLLACYPFDLSTTDESGDHHATVTSGQTAFVAGPDGTALGIQSQSVITVANSDDFATDSFTVELWLGPGFGSGFVFDYDNRFSVRIYKPNIVRCLIETDSKQSAEAVVDETRWSHIACVYDENPGLQIFVDQTQVGFNGTTAPLATATGTPAHVGSDSPGGGTAFLGAIDNLRVWGRGLEADQLCVECDAIGDPNM